MDVHDGTGMVAYRDKSLYTTLGKPPGSCSKDECLLCFFHIMPGGEAGGEDLLRWHCRAERPDLCRKSDLGEGRDRRSVCMIG